MTPLGTEVIGIAEKLLAILDRGSFTSTYKYAVLLALIELCLEETSKSGAAPSSVTTRQVASKVVALYWSHSQPIEANGDHRVLSQNMPQRGKSSIPEVVRRIAEFREVAVEDASATLVRSRRRAPKEFEALLDFVEWKLAEMPLPRLQRIGAHTDPFLYQIHWTDQVRRSEFLGSEFDNRILFVPGAAETLVRLSSLLKPLIRREWAATVARFNDLPTYRLEDQLFGVDRVSLTRLRDPLLDLQKSRCFFCGRGMSATDAHVDHFVPRARHSNDAIERSREVQLLEERLPRRDTAPRKMGHS
ncbi:MAG: hypothetical protein HY791_07615 [Deltaproteobacteria bacterium]|nr:hypothetical protein [Deltaproteobacteria bacterium]